MRRHRRLDADRILLVDDDVLLTRAWTRVLELHDYEVRVTESLAATEDFVRTWSDHPCSAVLLDVRLSDGDGTELLPLFATLQPKPLVAVVTAYLDFERALALSGQCALYAPKPHETDAILQLVEQLVRARRGKSGQGHALQLFAQKHALDARESAVVGHLMSGPNIGPDEALGCKPATVQRLWDQVFEKTGYESQLDVIRAVRRLLSD